MSGRAASGELERKAFKAVKGFNMISPGDELVIGVSGGADSMALLHFLLSMRQECNIRVTAVHVNHNLRGAESLRDENFVRSMCAELGAPLIVESPDVAALSRKSGKSIEECARDERYRVFAGEASLAGAKIVTAHTLSDSVETQLFNLARGSGIRGLCGVPPVRGNIIRPLIYCERRDVEDYCERHSLQYVTDSSNLSDNFTRNRMRHTVLPPLERINPSFLANASRAMELLRADADYLDREADTLFKRLMTPEGLDRERLLRLPGAMSSRLMLILCAAEGVPPECARVGKMMETAEKGGQLQLSEAKVLVCNGNTVLIKGKENGTPYFEIPVDIGSLPDFSSFELYEGKTVNLSRLNRGKFENNTKTDANLLKNAFDCDKIRGIVRLRQRLPADYIRLSGRGCSKSLKKLFNEAKIPPARRSGILVLSGDADELLWVEGFGVSESCAVTGNTKNIMRIGT